MAKWLLSRPFARKGPRGQYHLIFVPAFDSSISPMRPVIKKCNQSKCGPHIPHSYLTSIHTYMPMLGRWHLSIVPNGRPWRARALWRLWLMLIDDFFAPSMLTTSRQHHLGPTIGWNWKLRRSESLYCTTRYSNLVQWLTIQWKHLKIKVVNILFYKLWKC